MGTGELSGKRNEKLKGGGLTLPSYPGESSDTLLLLHAMEGGISSSGMGYLVP